jgi:predicted nuclease of predicted toxin-antitoxin system
MKLLLDANLSPAITAPLTDAGYETSHVGDVGLLRASDSEKSSSSRRAADMS